MVAPVPCDLPFIAAEERGSSFEAMASEKAVALSQQLQAAGRPSLTIASDGGLLIPGLGSGWNPLTTRRFAGEAASDLERAELLLRMADSLDGSQREIGWREAVAIANHGTLAGVWSAQGDPGLLASTVDGALVDLQPGFWIPAIWLVPQYGNRPLASLTAAERVSIDDHWRKLQEPVRGALARLS